MEITPPIDTWLNLDLEFTICTTIILGSIIILFRFEEFGLGDHNYCRNPDNEPEGPWCYNGEGRDPRWEYCGIPHCAEGRLHSIILI